MATRTEPRADHPGSNRGPAPWLPGLDGLRGIAVAAVLVAHLGEFVVPDQAARLLPGGFLGVDVFFVLSGFLITGLLLDGQKFRGGVRLRRFWWRRAVRLLPGLAVLAVGYTAVSRLVFDDPVDRTVRTFTWSFALVSNWQLSFGVQPPLDLLHLWTLSVEAQFYLLAPLAAVLAVRFGVTLRTTAVILAVGIAASAGVRALEWAWWQDPGAVYTRTETRADALLGGALLAVAWRAWPAVVARLGRLAPLGALGLAGCAALAHPGDPWLFQGGFTVVAFLTVLVVAGATSGEGWVDRGLRWSPAQVLGRMSYSVYLWHLPIYFWVLRWSAEPDPWFGDLGDGDLGRIVLCLSLTGLAGTASYLAVERPLLRRRRR